MVERFTWHCPRCSKAYRVPVGSAPTLCPECMRASSELDVLSDEPRLSHSARPIPPALPEMEIPVATRKHPRRRPGLVEQLCWLLDLRFDRYLTRLIVQGTWVLILGLAAVVALSVVIAGFRDAIGGESQSESGWRFEGGPLWSGLAAFVSHPIGGALLRLMGLFFAVCYLRVLCESVIVIFNISARLASIEDRCRGLVTEPRNT